MIVWKRPSAPNGEITGYDVMFTFSDGTTRTERVDGDITHYVIAISIPSGVMRVKVYFPMSITYSLHIYSLMLLDIFYGRISPSLQVRAINEAGPGPYSDVVTTSE